MATNDLRRTDVRTNVRINPFWIVSAEFGAVDTGDDAVLFGFPLAGGNLFVHEVLVVVSVAFTDDNAITGIGYGTLAENGTLTDTDDTRYMAEGTDMATVETPGVFPGGTIAIDAEGAVTGADWAKAKIEGTIGHLIITGADYDSMPVVYAPIAAAQAAGTARCHMLVSRIQ